MVLASYLTNNFVEEFLREKGYMESGTCSGWHEKDTFLVSVLHSMRGEKSYEDFYLFENDSETGEFHANLMADDGEIYDFTEEFSEWMQNKEQEAEKHQEYYEKDRRA